MPEASATDVCSPADPLIGCTLGGQYRITALLGRGGMSRVYQAVQEPLQRAVALKVLRDDPADPTLQRRFLLEASSTSQLTHPNTITIFDYGADQGLLFFAMERLRGCNLSQALRRDGPLPEARTLHIARQIARSLREAHARGLVHRDLKPSNLFLVEHADEADFVKVLDFGLVKVFGVEDLSGQLTAGGLVLGTPHYMAPEQARGLACDQRSDIYSLGVVLFQMLAGRVPFDGPSTLDVLLRHATEPVPRLRDACPGLQVSEGLEAVVAKCLAKKPEQRFQDMEELLLALPGDRPNGARPPPLPLDFGIDEIDAAPVSSRSETARMRVGGDMRESLKTPRVACEAAAGTAPPQATQRNEEAPRFIDRRGVLVGVVVAIALIAGAAVGLRPWARGGYARAPAPMHGVPVAVPGAPPAPAVSAPPASPAKPEPTPLSPASAPAGTGVAQPASLVASSLAPKASNFPTPLAPTPANEAGTAAPAEPRKQPAKRADRQSASARRSMMAPEAASPEVIEALKERLARAVSGIRQCAMLDSHRGGRGLGAGELELSVTVAPSGQVNGIGLAGIGLGEKLETCIRAAVQRVTIEPFEGPPLTLKRSVSLVPR